MTLVQIVPAILIASLFHALALIIATKLMLEVPVKYGQAYKIVFLEYLAIAAVAAILGFAKLGGQAVAIVLCSFTYLLVGAACIGRWISPSKGAPLGVGNGVLIQAIQIPLIVPVLILASFLIDLLQALSN